MTEPNPHRPGSWQWIDVELDKGPRTEAERLLAESLRYHSSDIRHGDPDWRSLARSMIGDLYQGGLVIASAAPPELARLSESGSPPRWKDLPRCSYCNGKGEHAPQCDRPRGESGSPTPPGEER